ncbi:hypothetical protein POV84_18820 [Klebsiella variicola]|nr:hypothetical protein [Klebsiella pneumoniae]
MQMLNGFFRISQFSGVFGIQRSNVTLAGLHVFDCGVRQSELLGNFIALPFELGRVVVVVTGQPAEADYQADQYGADKCD